MRELFFDWMPEVHIHPSDRLEVSYTARDSTKSDVVWSYTNMSQTVMKFNFARLVEITDEHGAEMLGVDIGSTVWYAGYKSR